MRVAQHFEGYNFRRYDKPWIAKITDWPIGSKPMLKFGGWIGNDKDGGEAEIDANAGDIIRYGHRDNRGNGTVNSWGIVQDDGSILHCTEPYARKHWTQTQQVANDTTAIEIVPIDKTAIEIAEIPPQQHTTTPGTREIDPHAAIYIQSRAQMDFALIDEYAQMMRDGIEFDAAQGIEDASGAIYIFDGYHRGKAAEHINAMLRVSLKPGTKQDAEWLAFGANTKHGLRRTHEDIERVVRHALQHPNAAQKSDREIARHCGVDNKTIGNWRKYLEKEAAAQRDDDTPTPAEPDTATQTEIEGTERFWSIETIASVLRDYINAHSHADRINILQNLIKQTAAGLAHFQEIAGLLQGKEWNDGILYALAKTELTALQQATCETCKKVLDRAQMFKQDARWYCAKCFPAIQKQDTATDETATAREIEDIENIIMAKLPQNDLALEALREVMLNDDAFNNLYKQLPGFPTWLVKQSISAIHKRLSLARMLVTATPTQQPDREEYERIVDRDIEETVTGKQIQPEPEMQMRCAACRVMYPESKLTYKTGICPLCLNDQLNKMAADNRMMAAAFKVLDRMLVNGHAEELKREIYEEIYVPTPEGEPMPELKRIQPESVVKMADFQFYQEDRTKLVKAGLRLFRASWHDRQIKELSNIGSWRKFEEFDSKTAMQVRIRELMKEPNCIMENHDIERQMIEPETQPEPTPEPEITDDTPAFEIPGLKTFEDFIPRDRVTFENDDEITPDPRERVLYYKAQGLSVRKIADALKGEGITMSKSAVDRILQDHKEAQ